MRPDVVVVGGGIFGVTAAIELARRGARVRLLDPGPVPHPDASSTDISKLVRADYGADGLYAGFMLDAFPRWRAWNEELVERGAAPLFHETGMLVLARDPMQRGGFEFESRELLRARGAPIETLAATDVARRFPAWAERAHPEAYFNPMAGWAESGAVVASLAERARSAGVQILEGVRVRPLAATLDRVPSIETEAGDRVEADAFVVAAGAHTPLVLPELADRMKPIAQSILHFAPADPELFSPPRFVPWAADIARTGWYGFPSHPRAAGVVKVARHGDGEERDPRGARVVPDDVEPRFRAFLAECMPALADAPVVARRVCFYSDTFDGDFFIDRHPRWSNVTVASGGSGHAFKFAPLLGGWIADAALGEARVDRFRWRALGVPRREAARAR